MRQLIKILLFLVIPVYIFAQEVPKLTQEKLFQQIGELTMQVRLQAEYIDKLLDENKKLKEELKEIKK